MQCWQRNKAVNVMPKISQLPSQQSGSELLGMLLLLGVAVRPWRSKGVSPLAERREPATLGSQHRAAAGDRNHCAGHIAAFIRGQQHISWREFRRLPGSAEGRILPKALDLLSRHR